MLDIRTDSSIIFERDIPLRTICRASSANEIPILTKVHWLKHAAEGYQYLYARNIIHSDIRCNNLILTGEDHIKLIDFKGCSIDNRSAASCYEWFSYCPSMPRVSRRIDIFAFGCAIYEVLTGRPPYYELEKSIELFKQVEELYANQYFPDITNLPLSQLIRSCWCGNINSMGEVIQELEAFRTRPLR